MSFQYEWKSISIEINDARVEKFCQQDAHLVQQKFSLCREQIMSVYFQEKILRYPRRVKTMEELYLIALGHQKHITDEQSAEFKRIAREDQQRFETERAAYYQQRKWLLQHTCVEWHYNRLRTFTHKRYRLLSEQEQFIQQQKMEIVRLKQKLAQCEHIPCVEPLESKNTSKSDV